jgi:Zn-dependent peptidase ImmA (M78 family)
LGLSTAALNAAWPRWWSSEANESPSAQTELAFTVARRLGLDPRSLLEEGEEPRFLWRAEARFKRMSGETELERAGIESFGRSIGALLVEAGPDAGGGIPGRTAADLRAAALSRSPFVGLPDLLGIAWAAGVPVVDARVFPWDRKRVAAMAVNVGDQSTVTLVKETRYPARAAFYVGHDLGHIALGHLGRDSAVVDLEDERRPLGSDDAEEDAADEFALELLTGERRPVVRAEGGVRTSGRELARRTLGSANELRIEPGVLAEVYGYTTGEWATVAVALKHIYPQVRPAWEGINQIARGQLDLDRLPVDAASYVDSVLGGQAA